MKNDFCNLSAEQIRALNIPDELRGLLLSPFQFNDDGAFVAVPREAFQRFVDAVTKYAVMLSEKAVANHG